MGYLTAVIQRLRAAVDYLQNLGGLDEVSKVLAEVQSAIDQFNSFFKAKSVEKATDTSVEEAIRQCEEMRQELLSCAEKDEEPVTIKGVAVGGFDWISLLAPLVLQVIQRIIDGLKKQ